MIFNFSYKKCTICGNLTDDGGFISGKGWICLNCLDDMTDASCIDTTERSDENAVEVLQTGSDTKQS